VSAGRGTNGFFILFAGHAPRHPGIAIQIIFPLKSAACTAIGRRCATPGPSAVQGRTRAAHGHQKSHLAVAFFSTDPQDNPVDIL
jgi:hypothetical protein